MTSVVDLLRAATGLPPTEGIVLHLGDRIRIIVRPSGTEPKVKVYFEVVEQSVATGDDVGAARARGRRPSPGSSGPWPPSPASLPRPANFWTGFRALARRCRTRGQYPEGSGGGR